MKKKKRHRSGWLLGCVPRGVSAGSEASGRPAARPPWRAARGAIAAAALCLAGAAQAQDALPVAEPYSSAAHDALVVARREGRATPEQLLAQLRRWLPQLPATHAARPRLVSDAVALAAEQGQACEAAELSRALPLEQLLDYALAPLATAARHCADVALQGQVIQAWRARAPEAREPLRLQAFWHLDSGDLPGAERLAAQLDAQPPASDAERIGRLELQAALALARRQQPQALGYYGQILALAPQHADARRQTVQLLAAGGGGAAAWQQAQAWQQEQPGTFSALELATLRQEALGQQLRWAVAEKGGRVGAERTRPIDELLAQLAEAQQAAEAEAARAPAEQTARWQALAQQLQWDQSAAELERGRPAQALAHYEALVAQGVPASFHAQLVAARAQARLGRAHRAVRLYEQALAQADEGSADTWNARRDLVYAYADAGRFDDAQALLDRMKAQTPAYLRLAPQAQTPNPDYTTLHAVEADLLLMGDQLADARTRLTRLGAAAGMNTGFRAGTATLALRGEQPDRAIAQYQALLADDPHSLSVRADMADAWMGVNEWAAARQQVQALASDAPDDNRVQRLQESHAAAVAPRLEVEAGGESGNLATADRIWQLDSRLSSGLIGDAWRLHAGYTRVQGAGKDEDGGPRQHPWQRGALGLSWTRGRWAAEAQLQHANRGPYRDSVAAGLDLRIADPWRVSLRYDGDSPQTPWRARTAGIGARAAEAAIAWVPSERRRLVLAQSRLNFSDGNVRNGTGVQWRERWLSTPRLQLESTLAAERGRYRMHDDRPYFSPASGSSLQASVWAQWLTWRSSGRSFYQGVELAAGRYHQQGFGSGATWNLRYEHRWVLGPQAELSYGLSLGSHPYDGVREQQRRLYLQLAIPLR